MAKHLETQRHEEKAAHIAAKEAKAAYRRKVKATNSKIKQYIDVLRGDLTYVDTTTGGVFINLGTQVDFSGLPDYLADFLGKNEKKNPDEQIRVMAYEHERSSFLVVSVGTNGTDRYIKVKTRSKLFSADVNIKYYRSDGSEPKSIDDAWKKGTDLIQGEQATENKASVADLLMHFVLRETAQVLTSAGDRH